MKVKFWAARFMAGLYTHIKYESQLYTKLNPSCQKDPSLSRPVKWNPLWTNLRRPEWYKLWPAQMQEEKTKTQLEGHASLWCHWQPWNMSNGNRKQIQKLDLNSFQITLQLPIYTGLVGLMKPSFQWEFNMEINFNK